MAATYRRTTAKLVLYRLTQFFAGVVTRVWFRFRRRGTNNMPRTGPVVVLSNHQSYLDPLLIGCYTPRPISYLARDTLFTGVLGYVIRAYDAIPIDREGGGLAGIRTTLRRIKDGDVVLMFPEGTRSSDGELQPLKPGFIALVRRGRATVVPMALSGAFESLPRGGKFPWPTRAALSCGEPISPEEVAELDDPALVELVSKRIAQCLKEAKALAGRGE